MEYKNQTSLISNKVFYYTCDKNKESIIKQSNFDGKMILILHNIYLLNNKTGKTVLTPAFLLKKMGYKIIPKNLTLCIDLLKLLRLEEYIKYDDVVIKKNTLLEINIEKMLDHDEHGYHNFFKLDEEEINIIKINTSNNREFINQLKVYCYLKARVRKINSSKSISERFGGESETTWRTYQDIQEHTGVSDVTKAISNLKIIGLIQYINIGCKYKKTDINKKRLNCNNIYALTKVSKDVCEELKEGAKQYFYYEEKNGYKIITNLNENYKRDI
ncbi:MAG: hypothetical protein RSA91_00910 [Bacilli bacterium]